MNVEEALACVGERIRKIRQLYGLTLEEFGDKINVHFSTVSNWESGIYIPKTEEIAKISIAFNITSDYILGLDDKMYINCDRLSEDEIIHIQLLIEDIRKNKNSIKEG